MQRILRRLHVQSATQAAVTVALLASYPLLFVIAALPTDSDDRRPWGWLFLAVVAVSYLAEAWAPRVTPYLVGTLKWLQVGILLRWVFREVALLILVDRALPLTSAQFAAFALGLVALHAIRAAYSALVLYVDQRRQLPVITRNVDLGPLRIPDAPPRLLVTDHVMTILYLDTLPVAGGLVAVITGDFAWALAGAALALAAGVALCVVMAGHARRNRHLGDRAWVLATVNERIREHRPEVVLYFSGSNDSAYQVNMWLSTLAQLGRPAMIMMREPGLAPLLGRTSLPVVCIEDLVEVMNFSLPSVRVALFPANTAKNLHLLRVPGIGHVFINHGDSDKTASFNPYAKVYDEVWVAGKAGRDRYLRAQIGVRDEDIVEVGRPQLTGIHPAGDGPADGVFTVLYAPTWEGWLADECQTSLIAMGPAIIKALIAHEPRLRIIYKPHPFTGTRDPRAAQAHRQIVALIEQANQQRVAGGPGPRGGSDPTRLAAAADLAEVKAQLSRLAGGAPDRGWTSWLHGRADEATRSRDSRPGTDGDAEWQELTGAWHIAYWQSQEPWRHRVVTGPRPTLYDCFDHADLLISDISSVVADFIASGKPYAVANPGGRGEDEFRAEFPTAAAAYLLDAGCAALPGVIAEASGPGPDRLAPARRELKGYLLGPDHPDALTRFSNAVEALATRAARPAGAAPGAYPRGA
ncbi:MAG TPA: hypothetical protein VEH31_39145, partial [Streptosporangiaceae bacterium]|nr:hypothetical protein [Streptosporangiaceae bacterium]